MSFLSEANSVRRSGGALQPQGKKHGEHRDKWDGNNDTPLVRKHNPKNWLEQKIRMLTFYKAKLIFEFAGLNTKF